MLYSINDEETNMFFALIPSVAHISDEGVWDATTIPFNGSKDTTFFHPHLNYHEMFGAPDVIEFIGNLEHVSWLDHIATSPFHLLLISTRMVRVLESVGDFKARLIPTVIYSESIRSLVCDKTSGRRNNHKVNDSSKKNENFVILQLLENLDCLDRERTLVNGLPFAQSGIDFLAQDEAEHLELIEPTNGFPPVFRVPELVYYCFSDAARQACEKAGLKGLWWRPQP